MNAELELMVRAAENVFLDPVMWVAAILWGSFWAFAAHTFNKYLRCSYSEKD